MKNILTTAITHKQRVKVTHGNANINAYKEQNSIELMKCLKTFNDSDDIGDLCHIFETYRLNDSLHEIFRTEPTASEVKWSLFCAAVGSRNSKNLRPNLPASLGNEKGKPNFELLQKLVDITSNAKCLYEALRYNEQNAAELQYQNLSLLNYVLSSRDCTRLQRIYIDKLQHIAKQLPGQIDRFTAYVRGFRIIYADEGEDAFIRHKYNFVSDATKRYAFFGGEFEEIYCILEMGFVNYRNKKTNELSHRTLHLYEQLDMARKFSAYGTVWGTSTDTMQCILLCEYIPDAYDVTISHGAYGNEFIAFNADLVRPLNMFVYYNFNLDYSNVRSKDKNSNYSLAEKSDTALDSISTKVCCTIKEPECNCEHRKIDNATKDEIVTLKDSCEVSMEEQMVTCISSDEDTEFEQPEKDCPNKFFERQCVIPKAGLYFLGLGLLILAADVVKEAVRKTMIPQLVQETMNKTLKAFQY